MTTPDPLPQWAFRQVDRPVRQSSSIPPSACRVSILRPGRTKWGASVDREVVGRQGRVTVRIRGAGRPGEVTVQVRGATESFIAYCDGEVQLGEAVLVASSRGDRSVEVYPVNQLRVPPRTPPSEED